MRTGIMLLQICAGLIVVALAPKRAPMELLPLGDSPEVKMQIRRLPLLVHFSLAGLLGVTGLILFLRSGTP